MTANEFRARRDALLAQIIEINRRNSDANGYTIQPQHRSDADNLKLAGLSDALDALDVRFDVANPPTTCPVCGEPIPASRDGECVNAGAWKHVSP